MRALLALSGVLDAILAVVYWIRFDTNRLLTSHAWHSRVMFLGGLMLAAGACTIAAGFSNSGKGKSWVLVLNGLSSGALGAIFAFWTGPLAFRTVALLMVVMAISIGIYEFAAAGDLRGHPAGEWLAGTAGVVSFGFALAFLAFVFRWVKLNPGSPAESLHWLGSYFGFSAICMLGLAAGRSGPVLIGSSYPSKLQSFL